MVACGNVVRCFPCSEFHLFLHWFNLWIDNKTWKWLVSHLWICRVFECCTWHQFSFKEVPFGLLRNEWMNGHMNWKTGPTGWRMLRFSHLCCVLLHGDALHLHSLFISVIRRVWEIILLTADIHSDLDIKTLMFETLFMFVSSILCFMGCRACTCVAWITAGSFDGPAAVEYRGFSNVTGCLPASAKFSSYHKHI